MKTNFNRTREIFTAYIWFAALFYSISFLGGGGVKFREFIPWYVLISRDIVWLALIIYLGYNVRWTSLKHQFWNSEYGSFLQIFTILCTIYLLISLSHISHRGLAEVAQHDIRNILSYSLILPFLPFILRKKEDIYSLSTTFLRAGIVLGVFGIASRYIDMDLLTWQGRIVSTMSDPNNLGIFLTLCTVIVIANFKSLGFLKGILHFLFYSFALTLTNSITAYSTFNFALFFILLLKKGWIKAFTVLIATFYIFIFFSFIVKIVENPNVPLSKLTIETYSTDKYLIDRMDNLSKGKFSNVFLFGMDFPTIDIPIRSLTYRKAQLLSVILGNSGEVKEMHGITKTLTLFGSFELNEYATFDNQYFNLIVNTGVISTVIFSGLFLWGAARGIKNYFYFKKINESLAIFSLSFSIFVLSMTLVGFNGAAFLNRFPFNFLMYLSLGIIFLIPEIMEKSNDI